MPEPVEIPEEVQRQIGTAASVSNERVDPFAVLDMLNEEVSPPVVAEEEPAIEEEAPVQAQVVAHPPELIERATILMIPANEVAEMSTAELRRVIKHADRVGQAVNDYHAGQAVSSGRVADDKKPTADAQPPDELAILDDPEKYDQEFVKPIKAKLAKVDKLADENKALRDRLEKLEKTQANSHQQTLHTRLTADLEPEVAKVFDLATPAGQKKYGELLRKMGVDQADNNNLSEKQLRARAIKAMEIVPEKPKEAPATTEAKKRWDNAALAKPSVRNGKESLEDIVGRIMKEDAAKSQQRTAPKQTNGQAAN